MPATPGHRCGSAKPEPRPLDAHDDQANARPGVEPAVKELQLGLGGGEPQEAEGGPEATASGVQFSRGRHGRPHPLAGPCSRRTRRRSRSPAPRRQRPGRRTGGARCRRRRGHRGGEVQRHARPTSRSKSTAVSIRVACRNHAHTLPGSRHEGAESGPQRRVYNDRLGDNGAVQSNLPRRPSF